MKPTISTLAQRISRVGLAASLSIGLFGCGEEMPFSSLSGKVADGITSFNVKGTAVDGLIRDGEVTIYDFDGGKKGKVFGTSTTDDFGLFSTVIEGAKAEGQYLMACVEGGEYTEEATGQVITLEEGDSLCAIKLFDPAEGFDVVINPFSNLAVAKSLHSIAQNTPYLEAIDRANTSISTLYGFDILSTVPRDLTDPGQTGRAYDDSMKMGSSIAGISRYVLDRAGEVGVTGHSDEYSSIKFHQAAYKDILADGMLDGIGKSNDGQLDVNLGMGNTLFTPQTYAKELAIATLEFARSDKNKTDLSAEAILNEQQRITSSTSPMFPPLAEGEPVPSLDEVGPVVNFNIAEGVFISGTVNLEAELSDFTGVQSLKLYVGGTEVDVTPGMAFDYSIQHTGYARWPAGRDLGSRGFIE